MWLSNINKFNNFLDDSFKVRVTTLRFSKYASIQYIIDVARFNGERLCNGMVSVRVSVCLYVPSIDSQ